MAAVMQTDSLFTQPPSLPERRQSMFSDGAMRGCQGPEIIARYEKLTVIYAIMLTKYLLAHN